MFLGIGFSLCIDSLNGDPAAGSAPLLTTIADMTGITLLCLCALFILGRPEEGAVPSYCDKMEECIALGVNVTVSGAGADRATDHPHHP